MTPEYSGEDQPARTSDLRSGSPTVSVDRRAYLGLLGSAAVGTLAGCLDMIELGTDRTAWRVEADGAINASPTIVDETVYFAGTHIEWQIEGIPADIVAVSAADGTEDWRVEAPGNWIVSSPTVVDGTLFIGWSHNEISEEEDRNLIDGGLQALDAGTGDERWNVEIGERVVSSPTVADGTVFVGALDDAVYAVDVDTGHRIWEFETDAWIRSSPTVVDGTVFIGSNDATLYALEAETGNSVWEFELETGEPITSSSTVADGVVLFGEATKGSVDNHYLYAVDAATGELEWQYEMGLNVSTSPTVADGTVFVGSDKVYALDLMTGETEWTYDDEDVDAADGTTWYGSPTVAGGTVVVGEGGNRGVYALDAGSGETEWTFDDLSYRNFTISSDSEPTVVDGTVYIGAADGAMYALDGDIEASSEGSRVLLGTLGHHDRAV